MESELLGSWQEERAELRAELSHLQDELAESRAEREELESRALALTDRLSQTLDPSLSFSLRRVDEQREWGKKLREGREREARQALLIHKLQNKVVEYRARCQALEQQVISEERELRSRERLLRDERSDTLESTLIRLEEEQQRCMGLSEVNVLLRSQLSQSTEANDALRDDLRKLTADWSKAVEEVMQKEIEWQKEKESLTGHIGKEQTRLMTLWGRVVTLKRQCHSLKTATDKDLWELRAEVSRVSSSLLSVWTSAHSAHTLPLNSTAAHPLSSTQGPLSLDDLEHDQSKELKVDLQSETLELRNRIAKLNMNIKALESEREKQEAEMERKHTQEMERMQEQERKQIELERNFESVRHAVRTLGSVVNSQEKSGQSNLLSADDVSTEGLSSVLSVIAQAETALQWKQQEVQDAQISMRRLGAEKEMLEQKMAQLEREREELQEQTNQGALEIMHTQELLNSEREMVTSLGCQAEEAEKLMEGLRKENEHMRRQRERAEEVKIQMDRERQKRVETEMMEVTQLCERDTRSRLELHSMQRALEREKLDRERAEQEAVESKDSLQKARESLLGLSSSQGQLKRELAEGRDALERIAPLNEALAKDKRELGVRALQLETEVAEAQAQIQAFGSEMASLRRELKKASLEANDLRERREMEQKTLQQLRGRERELENKLDTEKEERVREVTALMEEKANNEQRIAEVSDYNNTVMKELQGVQAELLKSTEQQRRAERERDDLLRESQRLEDTICALEREKEELARVKEELGGLVVCFQEHMAQFQEQASGLVRQCSQLQTQVDTLTQTKDVLQGEIQCLQSDLERETEQRERDKQVALEEKSSCERETENWRSAFTKIQHDIEQTLQKSKRQEEENKTEREKWQREREALNTELGQKDGEVEILRNRVDGLLKENEELLDLLKERNAELEKLQTKLAAEMKTAERRLKDTYDEIERWKQKENEIQRDKKELNHRFIERVEMESQNLKIIERERANMSDLLKKKEDDVRRKEEAIEELKVKVLSLERVIDSLAIELKEKDTFERRVAALEEHNVQLRQREIEKTKENESSQKTRDELETRLRGQLEQKDGELKDLKSRVEKLMREKEHMSFLMKEREQDIEKLQTALFTEKKVYELRLKEAQDNTDWWKRQAADTGKEKEQVKLVSEREKAELKVRLREKEEQLQKIEDDNEDFKGRIQSLKEIIKKLKTDAELKEIQLKLLHEQNSQIQEREIEKQREMERKLTELKEQKKQLRRELEDLKTKMEGLIREKERMLEREEKTEEDFQTKITEEQNIFEQKLKAEHEEINRLKAKLAEIEARKSWEENEEERRKIHKMEEREKERRLREELLQKDFELGQSRLKIAELNEENEQDKTTRLELQEDLKRQTTLLRDSGEEVQTLKKSLQQKEKQERDQAVHEEEEMRSLREKLQEVEQKSSQLSNCLRESESAFEKEKHQHREKEEEFLYCKQELLLVRRERDQGRENVEELQMMMDEQSKELKTLTRKLDEKSEEIERLQEDAQVLKASMENSEEEKEKMKRSLSQIENDKRRLEIQLRVEKTERESLKARLGDLQKDQHILMKENTGCVEKLGARVKELEEERDGFSTELRRKEREIRDLKDEALLERREKERLSSLLNEGKEKLDTLQEEVVVLAKTKEHTRSKVKEHEEQNQKMREGLIAGLQEMATLKELLEESHREGERLRSMLQEKKDELVRNRDECVRAMQAEAKVLVLKVQMLEKENKEFRIALRLHEEDLKKNQEERMQEKEEINRREDKFEEELKVVEIIAERKESELTRARARMDVLEQQRTELSSMAAERSRDAEDLSLKIIELRQEVNGLKEDKIRENEEKQRAVEELELLRKTCSEKETELIKEGREDETRNNKRLQQDEERNAGLIRVLSERLKDKETELRSIRETAYKEESLRLKLQDKFEDEKRSTGRLKEHVEMLEKEKQELNTKFEGEMRNIREIKYQSAKVDSGHGTLTDLNEYHSHEDTWLEIETLRKKLTRKGQEVEMMRINAQSLQTDIDRLRKQRTSENEDLERLKKQMSLVLLEKEERDGLLSQKDIAVCALRERADELGKDRDRIRLALEKTEAMLIYYKERLGQQEQKRTQSGTDVTQDKKTEPHAQAIDEANTNSGVPNRLSAMQQVVAQLEIEQNLLQRRNTHLEKKIERLRSERHHLRETLTQVELERGKLSCQLSQTEAGVQSLSGGTDKEELKRLRIRANELEEQVHHLRLMLAADHKQRGEFIDRSLKNSQSVMSLRQDLNESLAVVSQQLFPSVLKSETQKLDRSFREQELRLSLSQI